MSLLDILDQIIIAEAKEKAGMKGEKEKDWAKEDWDWDGDGNKDWKGEDGFMSSQEFYEYVEGWKRYVQIIFLSIAIMNTTKLGLELFRFRRPDNYYINGDRGVEDNNANLWKLAN